MVATGVDDVDDIDGVDDVVLVGVVAEIDDVRVLSTRCWFWSCVCFSSVSTF